jgi:hypothetical protein
MSALEAFVNHVLRLHLKVTFEKLKCQSGFELKSWQKRYDTFVETSMKPMT